MFTERCVNLSDNVSVMNKVRLRQNKRNWRKRPQFIVQSSDFHVQITFSAGVTVVDKCDPSSSSVVNRTQRKNASHTRWSSTVSCKQKPLAMWDLDFQSSAHNQKQELSHTKRDLNCHQSKVPFTIEGQITFSPYFPEGSEFCIKVRFTYVHQTQSQSASKKGHSSWSHKGKQESSAEFPEQEFSRNWENLAVLCGKALKWQDWLVQSLILYLSSKHHSRQRKLCSFTRSIVPKVLQQESGEKLVSNAWTGPRFGRPTGFTQKGCTQSLNGPPAILEKIQYSWGLPGP